MALEKADIAALACPESGNGDAGRVRMLDFVLPTAVKGSIKLFLSERGAQLSGENTGLREQLERIVAEPLSGEQALAMPVAQLQHAIHAEDADPIWAAAALAAERSRQGARDPWRVVLSRPRQLRFGPALSPLARTIEVFPQETSRIELRLDGAVHDGAFEPLPFVRIQQAAAVITPSAPSDALWVLPEPAFTEAGLPEVRGLLEGALAQIEQYAPEYLPWIERMVRHVVPTSAPKDMSISRSIKGQHGVIYVSFPASLSHTAEVLVHEASHQYINMLEHVAFVANVLEDDKLYFSPYVNKERNIDRIFFAYHAFANVLLYHRRCLAGGIPLDHYVGNNLPEQERLLGVLQSYLRTSKGLSAVGRTIFEPLDERVGSL